MVMSRKWRRFLLFAILFLPMAVLAMAGHLNSPSLAFPAEFPEASRTNIIAALTQPEYKFVGGEFVNFSTQLYYSGDTKALNHFLQRLSKCPDANLSITFAPRIEMEPAATWSVSHSAGYVAQLYVQVNFNARQIHLEELVLPEIKGGK
jgi:hypothetical protein